jgi:hypothetical protein
MKKNKYIQGFFNMLRNIGRDPEKFITEDEMVASLEAILYSDFFKIRRVKRHYLLSYIKDGQELYCYNNPNLRSKHYKDYLYFSDIFYTDYTTFPSLEHLLRYVYDYHVVPLEANIKSDFLPIGPILTDLYNKQLV